MIITKLQGGLGNQLFQWAIAKNLSVEYDLEFYLDISFYKHQPAHVSQRIFSLNKFSNLNIKLLDYNDELNFIKIQDFMDFEFIDIILDNKKNYLLNGYWQTEKYFYKNSDIIKKEIGVPKHFFEKIDFITDNSVSIHVRRTDYLGLPDIHVVQDLKYYEEALRIINDYDKIIVFSDDIEWCKENINFENVHFVEGYDDIEDLWIMSMCKNNIIANSSFSWWGAWLNNNPEKKIIAPKKWFGDKVSLNTNNICPNKWTKI